MGSCPVVTGKTVPSCTWWGTPQAGRLVGSSPLGVTSARPWCALGQGGHLASQVQSWGLSLVETVRSPHVPGCGHTPIVLILPSFPPPPHLPPRSHPPGSCSVTQSCWIVKSWTRLSDFTCTFHFHALEKEMATHSSILAWRIPGTEEPSGLPSMGSHRVGHD